MPLKHLTETLLVLVLGCVLLLTGLVIGVLPPLSQTILPWLIAFVLSLVYPLVLYPLFKSGRADYPFRMLHSVPAVLLLIWMVFDVLASYKPSLSFLKGLFTWGWGIVAIVAAFAALALFCIQVLRQRNGRLLLLAALLIPFTAFAAVSERYKMRTLLAAALWNPQETGSGTQVAIVPPNTSPSDHPDEEQWRAQLRRMERRKQRLEQHDDTSVVSWLFPAQSSSSNAPVIASASSSSAPIIAAKPPPKLSSSGPADIGAIGLLFLAAYCGVLHQRTIRRKA